MPLEGSGADSREATWPAAVVEPAEVDCRAFAFGRDLHRGRVVVPPCRDAIWRRRFFLVLDQFVAGELVTHTLPHGKSETAEEASAA